MYHSAIDLFAFFCFYPHTVLQLKIKTKTNTLKFVINECKLSWFFVIIGLRQCNCLLIFYNLWYKTSYLCQYSYYYLSYMRTIFDWKILRKTVTRNLLMRYRWEHLNHGRHHLLRISWVVRTCLLLQIRVHLTDSFNLIGMSQSSWRHSARPALFVSPLQSSHISLHWHLSSSVPSALVWTCRLRQLLLTCIADIHSHLLHTYIVAHTHSPFISSARTRGRGRDKPRQIALQCLYFRFIPSSGLQE